MAWTCPGFVDSLLLGAAPPELCKIGPFGTGRRRKQASSLMAGKS